MVVNGKKKVVRQSQRVQSATDSSGTVVPVSTHACSVHLQFVSTLVVCWGFALNSVYVSSCILIQGPKFMYNCRLSWRFLLILNSLYFGQTWQFSSLRQLCNLLLLFLSQRYETWKPCFLPNSLKMCLLFGGINERKLNIWQKMEEFNNFVFFLKTKIFLSPNKN